MTDARKPFKVRTSEGTLQSEHRTMSEAQAAAERSNNAAQVLEIKTRYEVQDEAAA